MATNTRNDAFASILIQPFKVGSIRRRLKIRSDGASPLLLFFKAHLLIEEAANGPKCLPLAEQWPAIDVVAVHWRVRFEEWA